MAAAVVVFLAFWFTAVVLTLSATSAIHHGLPSAESALLWAAPDPWSGGQYMGLRHFSAAELNRLHAGRQWGPIRFVPANVASTRPDIVSVNPIDDSTWGAAAYSVRDHRCYLMVLVAEPGQTGAASVLFAQLPDGSPCLGSAATPSRVKSTDLPTES